MFVRMYPEPIFKVAASEHAGTSEHSYELRLKWNGRGRDGCTATHAGDRI
jgi:hypothetical protein